MILYVKLVKKSLRGWENKIYLNFVEKLERKNIYLEGFEGLKVFRVDFKLGFIYFSC